MNGDDVGVLELADQPGLGLEAAHEVGLRCHGRIDDLQGDLATHRRLKRSVDLAGRTHADSLPELEAADGAAEADALDGQCRTLDRQGREGLCRVGAGQLVDPHRRAGSFESVLAEIDGHHGEVQRFGCRLAQQRLAAVGGRQEPGAQVQRRPEVIVVAAVGGPDVDGHANAEALIVQELRLRLGCCADCRVDVRHDGQKPVARALPDAASRHGDRFVEDLVV